MKSKEQVTLEDVYLFLAKHIKLLSIVFLIVFSCTYLIFRFGLTQLYHSEAIIYPANINSVSSEDPTEQALQILNSTDIKWKLIDSFGLVEHYRLNSRKFKNFEVGSVLNQNLIIERTPYSSISIAVYDKNQNLAASMANAVVELLNAKMQALKGEKFTEWSNFAYKKYTDKLKSIDLLEQTLNETKRENGILSFEDQAATLANKVISIEDGILYYEGKIAFFTSSRIRYSQDSIKLASIKLESLKTRQTPLQDKFNQLIAVGDKLKGIEQKLDLEREALIELKNEYEEADQNANRNITYSYVVSKAGVSEKPAKPKRLLSALLASFSAVFLLLFLLVFKEKFNHIKKIKL